MDKDAKLKTRIMELEAHLESAREREACRRAAMLNMRECLHVILAGEEIDEASGASTRQGKMIFHVLQRFLQVIP